MTRPMQRLARASIALAVMLAMLGSAGCGRKAMPEPRKTESLALPFINAVLRRIL